MKRFASVLTLLIIFVTGYFYLNNAGDIVPLQDSECVSLSKATRVIDSPGTYCLEADLLVDTNDVGITILSSDVSLDLQGNAVKRIETRQKITNAEIGIRLTDVERVTVTNGNIEGFYVGVSVDNSQEISLSDLEIFDIDFTGVRLNSSKNFVVSNSFIRDVGGHVELDGGNYAIGIQASGLDGIIHNNEITKILPQGNIQIGEGVGILLSADAKIIVENNKISGLADQIDETIGIWMGKNSRVQIRGNLIRNVERGIVGNPKSSIILANVLVLPEQKVHDQEGCCWGIFVGSYEGLGTEVRNNKIVNYDPSLTIIDGHQAITKIENNTCDQSGTTLCSVVRQ
jgi:hypothetical protein